MAGIPLQLNHITQEEWTKLLNCLDSEDRQEQQAYMEHYAALSLPLQAELGYMTGMLRAGLLGSVSVQYLAYMDRLSGLDRLRQPFAFSGWAGEHHDLGPAYTIRPECFEGRKPLLFYSDDDILEHQDAAQALAGQIAQESAGIRDVRVMEAEMLFFPGEESVKGWTVCFALEENDPDPVFVLPKAGEFNCCLGEMLIEVPRRGYMLARHSYCMK